MGASNSHVISPMPVGKTVIITGGNTGMKICICHAAEWYDMWRFSFHGFWPRLIFLNIYFQEYIIAYTSAHWGLNN